MTDIVVRKSNICYSPENRHQSTALGCALSAEGRHRPPHSITLSAAASNIAGIVNPMAFAALRSITNSNFVDTSTGRSAGFAPLKNLIYENGCTLPHVDLIRAVACHYCFPSNPSSRRAPSWLILKIEHRRTFVRSCHQDEKGCLILRRVARRRAKRRMLPVLTSPASRTT